MNKLQIILLILQYTINIKGHSKILKTPNIQIKYVHMYIFCIRKL